MNARAEGDPDRGLPAVFGYAALLGAVLANAMALALLIAVLVNAAGFYRTEKRSTEALLAYVQTPAELSVLFAIAIPIVVCVLAFAIVIAGVAIVIWTNWVQQALAQISRLSALCPTLPWWQQGTCYGLLFAAVGGLTAALGLFFTAAAVVLINVLVVIIALI